MDFGKALAEYPMEIWHMLAGIKKVSQAATKFMFILVIIIMEETR